MQQNQLLMKEIDYLRKKIEFLERENNSFKEKELLQSRFFERDMTNRCPPAFLGETPRDGYVCKNCNIPGHFIQNCPQKKRPPQGYVCKNCFDSTRDHFLNECPFNAKRQRTNPTI